MLLPMALLMKGEPPGVSCSATALIDLGRRTANKLGQGRFQCLAKSASDLPDSIAAFSQAGLGPMPLHE